MKLNLLPQTVSKGRAVRSGLFVGALILIGGIILAAAMTFQPQHDLDQAKERVANAEQPAADAVATAADADTVIATAADTIRDANLAKAMISHNDVYPKLYSDLKQYIPSFFRLTSMSAVPIDDTTCTVTLEGTLQSYQQYADVILSLMRWKEAKTITRSGYNYDVPQVPAISPDDTLAIPHKLSEPVLPQSQLDRLAYYESQNYAPKGFLGLNNYGTNQNPKGATPDESSVTIVLTVARDLRVPDVAATLGGGGGGAAGGGGMPMGMGGPMGGPMGRGAGGPPGVPPGANPGGGAAGAVRGGGAAGGD